MFWSIVKILIGLLLMLWVVLIVYFESTSTYSKKMRAEDLSFVPFFDWPNGLRELLYIIVMFGTGIAFFVYGILGIVK